ncbi:MAG: peptidoglycan editing factor PgeF [Rhizomicrobium sp.]|jgi:YfiH family protein
MLRLTAANLADASDIVHGFFGRQDGVSRGIYASLNCGPGSGDERAAVIANRARVQAALGATSLVTLYQIHSAQAVSVAAAWDLGHAPQADAMATNIPGIALGILTADCTPVLLADSRARVIGAAHAGWKGALAGVIESTLAAMEQLGAERARISAAIGPCISQANYEVGPEFRTRFLDNDSTFDRFFAAAAKADHWRFDLKGFVALRLDDAGIENVASFPVCTYAHEGDFFSFRRATHRGEPDYGREISAIALAS